MYHNIYNHDRIIDKLRKICRLKAGSQYSVRIASRPEVIIFSMGLDAARRRNRILFLRRTASKPIEKIMTFGWDATRWDAKDIL